LDCFEESLTIDHRISRRQRIHFHSAAREWDLSPIHSDSWAGKLTENRLEHNVNYAQMTRYIEGTLIVDFVDAKTGRERVSTGAYGTNVP
jgi:hypothetical protein